ncbi:MAG: response regulator transcription factor [Vicinamibacterales bacterium]
MAGEPIRVLCVDDHLLVREGIALVIERDADMRVVGSVGSAEEALACYPDLRPDVTLMDLQLGGMSGIEAIGRLRRLDPEARIVVLTVLQGDEDIFRALRAGAVTYLLKDTLSHDLVRVVREVHAGRRPVVASIEARLSERAQSPALSDREIQVVEQLSQGMRNKELAAALGITERTAEVHVRNILTKLNVKDRTAAVSVAIRRGIIHLT